MQKVQEYYKKFEEDMGWGIQGDKDDPEDSKMHMLYIHMLLTTEVAEVAEEFRRIFHFVNTYKKEGLEPKEAFAKAKADVRVDLGKEFADCLAYLCKLANFFDYDLEEELHKKLTEIRRKYQPAGHSED